MSLKKSAFQKNKYSILKNAISKEMADFCFAYFLNKRKVARFLFDQRYISPFTEYYGIWNDEQVPNTYSHYSDMVMETLLVKVLPILEKETDLKLMPTYSYMRVYEKGSILKKHKDRYSCEVSTTLNLGGDVWPIYLKDTKEKVIEIKLEPGDMLIYSGCELEHWRDEFEGELCGQVFLHYNDMSNPKWEDNAYDGRPHLGLPSWFKGKKVL